MGYTDKELNDYVDEHGFGLSSRLLESNEPIILNRPTSWESELLILKIFGLEYDNLNWYRKAEVKFDFLIRRLKNKFLKR